jgi:hypothetical protein
VDVSRRVQKTFERNGFFGVFLAAHPVVAARAAKVRAPQRGFGTCYSLVYPFLPSPRSGSVTPSCCYYSECCSRCIYWERLPTALLQTPSLSLSLPFVPLSRFKLASARRMPLLVRQRTPLLPPFRCSSSWCPYPPNRIALRGAMIVQPPGNTFSPRTRAHSAFSRAPAVNICAPMVLVVVAAARSAEQATMVALPRPAAAAAVAAACLGHALLRHRIIAARITCATVLRLRVSISAVRLRTVHMTVYAQVPVAGGAVAAPLTQTAAAAAVRVPLRLEVGSAVLSYLSLYVWDCTTAVVVTTLHQRQAPS